MLVVSRRLNQAIIINDKVRMNLSSIKRGEVEITVDEGPRVVLGSFESVRIAKDVMVRLLSSGANQARVAIDAPIEIPIHREEVFLRIQQERAATQLSA